MVVGTASQQVSFDLALEELMCSSQHLNNLSSSTQLSQRPNGEVPILHWWPIAEEYRKYTISFPSDRLTEIIFEKIDPCDDI